MWRGAHPFEQEDVHLEVGKPAEVCVEAKLKQKMPSAEAEDAEHENVHEDVREELGWLRLGWG